LTASQLDGMGMPNINALNVANLNATTVGGLTTKTISFLSSAQTASLLANQANNLSVTQISSFSAAQLSTTALVGAAGGLQFNLGWDSSVAQAPAGFRNAVIAAAAGLSANFASKAVVNIQIGYGEVAGSPISPYAAAESGSYMIGVGYSTLYGALQKDAGNSTIQAAADASLSAANPTSGGSFEVSTAEAKALGLLGATSRLDGYVGLSAAIPFEYNQTAAGGKYDAVGILQHEMSEVMGRTGSVGAAFGRGVYTALDMFRYTTSNDADPSHGTPSRALTQSGSASYFSIDGGKTDLGNYNPSNGGADYADWNASMGRDPFGYAWSGVTQTLSGNDVTELAAIGWNMTSKGVTAASSGGNLRGGLIAALDDLHRHAVNGVAPA
jgi:hypothetical protein